MSSFLPENFEENIKNLEQLNNSVFQPLRNLISETRNIGEGPIGSATAAENTNVTESGPVLLTDYDLVNRIYCIMLWVYWEELKQNKDDQIFWNFVNADDDLKELYALRNCLVHCTASVQKALLNNLKPDLAEILNDRGRKKNYIKFEVILLNPHHLTGFTSMLKTKYKEYKKRQTITEL